MFHPSLFNEKNCETSDHSYQLYEARCSLAVSENFDKF